MEEQEILETTYTPKDLANEEIVVFPDSDFLPIKATFRGMGKHKFKTTENYGFKFINGSMKYFCSEWCKCPLPLKAGDECEIYINKASKVEVLKLN
jgi:hypothetical protein